MTSISVCHGRSLTVCHTAYTTLLWNTRKVMEIIPIITPLSSNTYLESQIPIRWCYYTHTHTPYILIALLRPCTVRDTRKRYTWKRPFSEDTMRQTSSYNFSFYPMLNEGFSESRVCVSVPCVRNRTSTVQGNSSLVIRQWVSTNKQDGCGSLPRYWL